MKAIIHIGMMKTGSTSIRGWLSANRDALEAEGVRSNAGVGPRSDLKFATFQTAVHEMGVDEKTAWAGWPLEKKICTLQMQEIYKRLTNGFIKVAAESDTYVLSHEGLYKRSEIQMIALDKYLSKFFTDRTYVVYIRNYVDFFVSFYGHKFAVSPNYTEEFSAFMEQCMSNLAPRIYWNLFNFCEVLGDRLKVRLLESDWLVKGDLVEDFASLVGVPVFNKPGRMNESLAVDYIEYARFLNQEFHSYLPWNVRSRAINVMRELSSGKPKLAASNAQAKAIRDIHREQEEEFRKKFFLDRPVLFSPKFRGRGVEPVPLSERRKAEIESEIREKINIWSPQELARRNGRK